MEIISALFILLFLYAAVSKLFEYEKFKLQLGQSPLLNSWSALIAWLVPGIEILLTILLTLQATRLIALYASFCIMVMFTTYIVVILHFSEYTPCSCGGVLETMTWSQHLIFNIVFIALAAISILIYSNSKLVLK